MRRGFVKFFVGAAGNLHFEYRSSNDIVHPYCIFTDGRVMSIESGSISSPHPLETLTWFEGSGLFSKKDYFTDGLVIRRLGKVYKVVDDAWTEWKL